MFNPSFANEIDSLFVEETTSPVVDNQSAIIDQLLATTTTSKKKEQVELAKPIQLALMSEKQRQYIQQMAQNKGLTVPLTPQTTSQEADMLIRKLKTIPDKVIRATNEPKGTPKQWELIYKLKTQLKATNEGECISHANQRIPNTKEAAKNYIQKALALLQQYKPRNSRVISVCSICGKSSCNRAAHKLIVVS
jgi:uncharacterized membrane protein YfhO